MADSLHCYGDERTLFENQLISTVYLNQQKKRSVKLADYLIEGCENLFKSEVRNLFFNFVLYLLCMY